MNLEKRVIFISFYKPAKGLLLFTIPEGASGGEGQNVAVKVR